MKIVIVGLGNIGGSFALSIKENMPQHEIYAIDTDEETLLSAKSQNLITDGNTAPAEIIPQAELVIFSVYPLLLESLIDEYAPYFKKGTILTDVTGVKRMIIERIEPLLPDDVDFIFGHPMAGRENRGLQFASKEVFRDANYLITPTARNNEQNIQLLTDFLKDLGFINVTRISPEFHDEIIGFTSQLAHVIAISLINSDDESRNTKQYTGDSYRDLTRITNINEKLWPELFLMNKDYLMRHIDEFREHLDSLYNAIQADDTETMEQMMLESRKRYHDLHNIEMPDE